MKQIFLKSTELVYVYYISESIFQSRGGGGVRKGRPRALGSGLTGHQTANICDVAELGTSAPAAVTEQTLAAGEAVARALLALWLEKHPGVIPGSDTSHSLKWGQYVLSFCSRVAVRGITMHDLMTSRTYTPTPKSRRKEEKLQHRFSCCCYQPLRKGIEHSQCHKKAHRVQRGSDNGRIDKMKGNVIFSLKYLCGVVILATAIWLRVSKDGREILSPEGLGTNPNIAANILIAVGSIIMMLGFLGCCGAMKENRFILVLSKLKGGNLELLAWCMHGDQMADRYGAGFCSGAEWWHLRLHGLPGQSQKPRKTLPQYLALLAHGKDWTLFEMI
ncbi:hypothetical protein CB1_001443024 [Camelus ferus]|nr:hypothetical protein CB1_001443024 [Camelus ferus]